MGRNQSVWCACYRTDVHELFAGESDELLMRVDALLVLHLSLADVRTKHTVHMSSALGRGKMGRGKNADLLKLGFSP